MKNKILFRVKCIDNKGYTRYTNGNEYTFTSNTSFAVFKQATPVEWELIAEWEEDAKTTPKMENKVLFRARCIKDDGLSFLTTNKVYDCIENIGMVLDKGVLIQDIDTFDVFKLIARGEWELVEDNTMPKLKDGYVVEFENQHKKHIYYDGCMYELNTHRRIFHWTDDDIKSIYIIKDITAAILDLFAGNLTLIWQREEKPKEYTIKELESQLGHKIKIVGE